MDANDADLGMGYDSLWIVHDIDSGDIATVAVPELRLDGIVPLIRLHCPGSEGGNDEAEVVRRFVEWHDGGQLMVLVFFSSRRRHTRLVSDWSSDVCSSDLARAKLVAIEQRKEHEDAAPGDAGEDHPGVDIRTALHQEADRQIKLELADRVAGEIGRASCRERV